jgi:hypothetical protein
MENIVTEELDDVPIARLAPARIARKPARNDFKQKDNLR